MIRSLDRKKYVRPFYQLIPTFLADWWEVSNISTVNSSLSHIFFWPSERHRMRCGRSMDENQSASAINSIQSILEKRRKMYPHHSQFRLKLQDSEINRFLRVISRKNWRAGWICYFVLFNSTTINFSRSRCPKLDSKSVECHILVSVSRWSLNLRHDKT